jgi:uncharacterized membrane protein
MAPFVLALAVFVVAHVIPAAPPVRRRLVATLGEGGFLAAYSLLSLGLFAWLLAETLAAPYLSLWPPARWTWHVTLVLVPLALVLLGAGALAPNALSIAFVPGEHDPARPGAVALTRHPILWGLALWGLGHLPPNGHVAGVALFGGLGGFALLGLGIVERRRRARLGDRWHRLAAGTSLLPFAALVTGRARWPRDARTLGGILAGLLAALVLLAGGHFWLFGRDPLAAF